MYKTYIKKILKLLTSKKNYANGDIPYSWFIILNVIKMSSVPKLMYSVVQFIKILTGFLVCVSVCVRVGGATIHV